MSLLNLAGLALLCALPLGAGALVGLIIDSALNLRDLRRTGHVSACSAPHGWTCSCPSP